MTRLFAGTPFDIPPRCGVCGELESECRCTPAEKAAAEETKRREAARLPPGKQTARVSVQKRKGGRIVTVVQGLTAEANDLPELLTRLKNACGAGGTVRAEEDEVEIQGDHAKRVREALAAIGYRVKG